MGCGLPSLGSGFSIMHSFLFSLADDFVNSFSFRVSYFIRRPDMVKAVAE